MKKLKTPTINLVIFLFLISCNQKTEFKENDFQKFSISLPSSWKKIQAQSTDSDVDIVITKNNDSIYFDFGQYSQDFSETNKVFNIEQIRKYDSLKMDTKWLHFSPTPEIDQAQGTFLKEYYYYDTISKYIAKVKIPKKIGQGETGIHFSNINQKKLTIIGKNLNADEQNILVKSFNTITFK